MERSNPLCSTGVLAERGPRLNHQLKTPRGFARTAPPQRRTARADAARPQRDRANGGAASIDCLWVTRIAGRTIGMLRLVGVGPHVVRVALLRVDPEWHHTHVLRNLIQQAHDFCRRQGCVLVQCDTGVAPSGFCVSWRAAAFDSPATGWRTVRASWNFASRGIVLRGLRTASGAVETEFWLAACDHV